MIGIKMVKNALQKVFWVLAFAASIFGFSLYIYYKYLKPEKYGLEVIQRVRYVNASDFPFPSVTFCPRIFAADNSVNGEEIKMKMRNGSQFSMTEKECASYLANIQWCEPSMRSDLKNLNNCSNDANKINVQEIIYKTSKGIGDRPLWEVDFICEFVNRKRDKCDFPLYTILTDYGPCYTSTSQKPPEASIYDVFYENEDQKDLPKKKFSWSPEKRYDSKTAEFPQRAEQGTMMHIPVFFEEYTKQNACSGHQFFYLFFHSPNEIISPVSHDPILISYNEYVVFQVSISSHRTDIALKSFPVERRKCYFEGERKLKFFTSYTKAHCQQECNANFTLAKCKCVKFSMPREKDTKICDSEGLSCIPYLGIDEIPFCKCYDACNYLTYSHKIKRSGPENSFPTSVQVIMEQEAVEEVEKFQYLQPSKFQNFISDFGALFSLLMGCSLLSMIEICHFLISGAVNYIIRTWNNYFYKSKLRNRNDERSNFIVKEVERQIEKKLNEVATRVDLNMQMAQEKLSKIFSKLDDLDKNANEIIVEDLC